MKKGNFKVLLPHIIAISVFLIVSLFYCKPALEGKVLQQHDIVGAKGMAQNAIEFHEQYGHMPLWNTNLFSGMPNFQVLIQGPFMLFNVETIRNFGLPKPFSFFFVACVCFYILCMAFRINFIIAMLGALAFAYTTYNPIIIGVGHDTKMQAIAYMPGLLAGLVWIYEKKYWVGLAVTALFATLEITANHPQINFYFLIIAAAMTIAYAVQWIRNKEWKHTALALSLAIIGGLIGIGNSAVTLFTTYDYSKYTMRGGKTIESSDKGIIEKKTSGLDLDYAFSYSLGKSETATLLMPNAFGSSSSETFDEESSLVEELVERDIPEASAVQLAGQLPKYWGGVLPGTSGPVYVGAITCLLFVLGLVLLKTRHRWWIVGAVLFGILLAWGQYFSAFNTFIFENVPIYNKFRAPSMALVIPQFLIPLMSVLTLQHIFFKENINNDQHFFKYSLYAIGGLIALLFLVYLFNDYNAPVDEQVLAAYNQQQGSGDIGRMIVNSLIAARKSMFSGDLMRLIGFAALLLGGIYLWKRNILSPLAVIIILLLVNTIDLLIVGKKYLTEDNYVEKDQYVQQNFTPTTADQSILNDKADKVPHFRVYNLSPDRFSESRTSYFHRSLGGYHPAKLRNYQDLIEHQFSKNTLNTAVLNMLDTRYLLIPDQQTGATINIQKNDSALGAAWFIKELRIVNGPAEEIKALDNFNPATTAFIDKAFSADLKQSFADTGAAITLTKYNNDTADYVTTNNSEGFAVFSEIYYPAGWNAYVDDKKTKHYKVNYLLRGLPVPAGKHNISFRFEPESFYTGYTLALWSGIILYLTLLLAIFMSLRERRMRKMLNDNKSIRAGHKQQ
jgi:hypothetical protein